MENEQQEEGAKEKTKAEAEQQEPVDKETHNGGGDKSKGKSKKKHKFSPFIYWPVIFVIAIAVVVVAFNVGLSEEVVFNTNDSTTIAVDKCEFDSSGSLICNGVETGCALDSSNEMICEIEGSGSAPSPDVIMDRYDVLEYGDHINVSCMNMTHNGLYDGYLPGDSISCDMMFNDNLVKGDNQSSIGTIVEDLSFKYELPDGVKLDSVIFSETYLNDDTISFAITQGGETIELKREQPKANPHSYSMRNFGGRRFLTMNFKLFGKNGVDNYTVKLSGFHLNTGGNNVVWKKNDETGHSYSTVAQYDPDSIDDVLIDFPITNDTSAVSLAEGKVIFYQIKDRWLNQVGLVNIASDYTAKCRQSKNNRTVLVPVQNDAGGTVVYELYNYDYNLIAQYKQVYLSTGESAEEKFVAQKIGEEQWGLYVFDGNFIKSVDPASFVINSEMAGSPITNIDEL